MCWARICSGSEMRSRPDSVNIRAHQTGNTDMDISKRIIKHFKDSAELKLKVKEELAKPIADAAQLFFDCVANDGKILCCGNGGSAADAQHFAAELVNRPMQRVRRRVRSP